MGKMSRLELVFSRIKSWWNNTFEDRISIIVAVAALFYVLASAFKISLFNHVIVPAFGHMDVPL